ncbi:MAG: hypothetical protein JXR76_09490 [Deltaproteobacteria bacterium]|nr:hypothetical protein [Deltaproteobacteria bacterium]
MYSSTIKPTHQDYSGKGKQWSGEIGGAESIVAGIIPGTEWERVQGLREPMSAWAISFTSDWVVLVICEGDVETPLAFLSARRAENIGMSVLDYVDSEASARHMDKHLASYLVPDGILAMTVARDAHDEIQRWAAGLDVRMKGIVQGELYALHKEGVRMSIGVACIHRANHEAMIWQCGGIDVVYKSQLNLALQSVFEIITEPWSSKEGMNGNAQFVMCSKVAQISIRTRSAKALSCATASVEVPFGDFQTISVDSDAAWLTWCANSVPGETVDLVSQQFLHGRSFTDNVRLVEEIANGFFYLGNKHLTLEDLMAIFDSDVSFEEMKGLCLADCILIDDACIMFLAKLSSIRYLDLRNTAVSPNCLMHLKHFGQLRYLDLTETRIRAADLAGIAFPPGMRLKIDT